MHTELTKVAARRLFLKQRGRYGEQEILDLSRSLLHRAKALPLESWASFHIFLSIEEKKEIQTTPFIEWFWQRHKRVIVPKTDFKTQTLQHVLYTPQMRLTRNKYGMPEPSGGERAAVRSIDVVFVPLLAFDRQGHRVGYGGGFYDRFLKDCHSDSLKIGLSLFEPIDRILDVDSWDFPLTHCLTPSRTYAF